MKRVIKTLTLMVIAFMVSISGIKAYPEYTTKVGSFPSKLQHVFLGSWGTGLLTKYSGANLYYKYTDKQNHSLMCTNFAKDNNDKNGNYAKNECTPITGKNPLTKNTDWSSDKAVSAGVAAIIIEGSGGLNNKMTEKEYHSTELAINTYLDSAKSGKYSKIGTGNTKYTRNFSSVSGISSLSGKGKNAQTAYTKFSNAKMGVTIGKFKCTGTTCKAKVTVSSGLASKYNTKTNYYSKVSIEKESLSVTGGATVSYSNGVITVSNLPTNNTSNITYTVTAKFKASRTYYLAQNYSCGSGNQTLTPNLVKEATQSKSKQAKQTFTIKGHSDSGSGSGTVEIDTPDYLLYKTSSVDGTPLTGATLQYCNVEGDTCPEGHTVSAPSDIFDEDNIAYLFYSEGSMYNIQEAPAPTGYKLTGAMPKNIVVTKDSSNNITGATITYHNGTSKTLTNSAEDGSGLEAGIELPNAPDTSLTILKIDGDTKQYLSGSTLALYEGEELLKWDYVDSNGTVVSTPQTDQNGNYLARVNKEDGAHTTWITSEHGMKFVELAYDVEYDIVESSAPDGYIINNDVTTATLTNDSAETRNVTKTITNYPSSVTLSKQDITSKKELPGAKLQITDGQGNVFDSWTSTTKPHVIKTLKDGTYYLQETTAPNGYALNTETIEFTVVNGKAKTEVVMYNSPAKTIIPNTLLSKNVITYLVGGILILVGAGVLYYELKKKKVSE